MLIIIRKREKEKERAREREQVRENEKKATDINDLNNNGRQQTIDV